MDRPDQARRKQRDQRGLSQCILLALALVGIAATTFINLTGAASAQSLLLLPATAGPIQPVERAVPIGAWIKFCQKQPQECQIDHSQPAQFPLTPGVWATLIRVNEHVNSVILAVTDQDHGGVVDLLGGTPEQVPEAYDAADPATRMRTRPRAHVVVVHGDVDADVPVQSSRGLGARFDWLDYRELAGVDHFAVIDPLSDAWPEVRRAIRGESR